MKRLITVATLMSLVLAVSTLSSEPTANITKNLTSMPLAFTANQGQWDEKVLFRANAGGATMWFASDGAYYQFTRRIPGDESLGAPPSSPALGGIAVGSDRFDHKPDNFETMMIKASFVGTKPNPRLVGEDVLEYKCNYFIGNDPARWRADVPNYSAVIYEEIYPGIDLKYYGNGKEMEYDFIVSPGADPSQIRIQYEGEQSISVNDDGELVVTTRWGQVTERCPIVYQLVGGERVELDGEYRLTGDNSFGFSLGTEYDPTLLLVIDPLLSYSTYLGGNFSDGAHDIAVDNLGCAYIVGMTNSTDFPTENEYQTHQGDIDVFVTKLNSSGNGLVYSTYLGGGSSDYGRAIAIDVSGCAYVTGLTHSTDFPTVSEYQTDQNLDDVFVAKLNAAGDGLLYSTYLGGGSSDYGNGIAVDGSGCAYVAGLTQSVDFPTENPYQTAQLFGDVFVTKLNSSGNDLVYSTYLGGSALDDGQAIAVDGSGCAFVTGYTGSADFPTQNPYQTDQVGYDVIVTKLNGSGDGLVYSTYLGGSEGEYGYGIKVDGSGCAYVTGNTMSADFPTENPYQTHQGVNDFFVTKFSSTGGGLVYSTYLGGNDADLSFGIAVDGSGCAYVAGCTSSGDFPTVNAYQTCQPFEDIIVAQLNSSGNGLVYSTYLGGDLADEAKAIAVDASGCAYVTGLTASTDYPTEGEYQTNMGYNDIIVTKLAPVEVSVAGPAEGDLPTAFALSQNRPNPFNPTTEISFSLPHASFVKLEIFNIKGQRISTLVSRHMNAGYHTVSFDGSKVASGIYLYRLTAGEFVESKKMLLVK